MTDVLRAAASVVRIGDRVLVFGTSRDAAGAVAQSADDLRETSQLAVEWLADALLQTLESSAQRTSQRSPLERTNEAEAAIVKRLGLSSWAEVERTGQRAAVYDYGQADYDIVPLAFVEGRSVMQNLHAKALKNPAPADLADAVMQALDKYEYRKN